MFASTFFCLNRNAITKDELAKHCRRRTRGVSSTKDNIEALLLAFSSATDTLGVPLFKNEIREVWIEQQRHLGCIQDPEGIQLYTLTGHITKGGIRLPVYRCARGSTSLESFHLHLVRMIPGTSANAVNFQAYLLDGITRWNASRSAEALSSSNSELRTFDMRLQEKVNKLHDSLFGEPIFPNYQPPAKYTGELIGVEYLFHETGVKFELGEDLDQQIDEGFIDHQDDDREMMDESISSPALAKYEVPIAEPVEESGDDDDEDEVKI